MFHFKSISFTERKWVEEGDREKEKQAKLQHRQAMSEKAEVTDFYRVTRRHTHALCHRKSAPCTRGVVFVSVASWYLTVGSTMSQDMSNRCDILQKDSPWTIAPKMTSFCSKSESAVVLVPRWKICVETLFAHFLVEHNIALSASDHAGEMFRNMFPNSKIAKSYASGRTKITRKEWHWQFSEV